MDSVKQPRVSKSESLVDGPSSQLLTDSSPTMRDSPQIIALSESYWATGIGARHHLSRAIARFLPVLYVEPPLHLRDSLTLRNFLRHTPRITEIAPNLKLFRFPLSTAYSHRPYLESIQLRRRIRNLRKLVNSSSNAVIFAYHARAWRYLSAIADIAVYYFPSDAYSEYLGNSAEERQSLDDDDRAVAERARAVFPVSRRLAERYRSYHKFVRVLPNCVQIEEFSKTVPDRLSLPHVPRVILVAKLNLQFQYDILIQLAESNRFQIVVAGELVPMPDETRIKVESFLKHRSVEWVGRKHPSEIPQLIQSCDAGICPYDAGNPTVQYASSLKLMEYLAAGLPVVATHIDSMEPFREHILFPRTISEWPDAVEQALHDDNPWKARERREVAAKYSWDKRAAEVYEMVANFQQNNIDDSV